jgi:thiol-disulfide isomerase/thioredoxin
LLKNVILTLLLISTSSAVYAANDGTGPEIGKPAPMLNASTLDGGRYRLKTDLGSKKVINFFGVTCHACRDEMPELARLEKKFKDIKFISVHTILLEPEQDSEAVARFIKSLKGAPSNIVMTSSKQLGNDFNISALPHTLILDENNIVLMSLSGYDKVNIQNLDKALQHLTKP